MKVEPWSGVLCTVMVPPINWQIQHTGQNPTDCDAFLQVQHGKFVPLFTQPFVCYPHNSPTIPNV